MPIRLLHRLLSLTFWFFAVLITGATLVTGFMLITGVPVVTSWTVATAPVAELMLPGYDPAGATIAMNRGELTVESGNRMFILVRLVDVLVRGALWLPALWLLRRVVGDLRAGQPFGHSSFRQLRITGYLLLAIPLWQMIQSLVTQSLLLSGTIEWPLPLLQIMAVSGERLQVFPEFNPWFLVAGLITLVLAEVFRAGFDLQQDSDAII